MNVELEDSAASWEAPNLTLWLADALEDVSDDFFGQSGLRVGWDGTIHFVGMLHKDPPAGQYAITVVLRVNSNAHELNEFLHFACTKKRETCIAQLIERSTRFQLLSLQTSEGVVESLWRRPNRC